MNEAFSRKHGSLYDRGAADSWYCRPRDPHWYPAGSGKGQRLAATTEAEIAEYNAGYYDNEAKNYHKEYAD